MRGRFAPIAIMLLLFGALIVIGGIYYGIGRFKNSDSIKTPLVVPDTIETSTESTGQAASSNSEDAVVTEDVITEKKTKTSEIAFLRNGNVWILYNNLEQDMLIDTEDSIINFAVSPGNDEIYWITSRGELWKRSVNGDHRPLITFANDMNVVEDTKGDYFSDDPLSAGEKFNYVRGAVHDFHVSPDGTFIVYEAIERYTGCCGSFNTIPTYSLWVMKDDGSEKIKLVDPENQFADFRGWLPNNRGILYSISAPDEPTTGQGFYKTTLAGTSTEDYKVYCCYYVSRFPGTAPVYSPDGEKVAYYHKGAVFLARAMNADDPAKKKLVDYENGGSEPFGTDAGWSADSRWLYVKTNNIVTAFDSEGNEKFTINMRARPWGSTILSEDNHYVALKTLNDGKISIALLDLFSKETRNIDALDSQGVTTTTDYQLEPTPKYISETGKFYYIQEWKKVRLTKNPPPDNSLWSMDLKTEERHKIADNVSTAIGY